MKITNITSLPANPGIYEAITGNFLDSYNLSLLNPYMVRVFCNWFSNFYYTISSMNICSMQPNLSAAWLFQRAMSAKQQYDVSPDFISELLYVNFQSMQVGLCSFKQSQRPFASAPLAYTFLFFSSLMSSCVTSPEARWSSTKAISSGSFFCFFFHGSWLQLDLLNWLSFRANLPLKLSIVTGCYTVWASCQDIRPCYAE